MYNGKTLSEWMWTRQIAQSQARLLEAEDAVRHIGTNALPWFGKWLTYEPPTWKRKMSHRVFLDRLPAPLWRLVFKREFQGLTSLDGLMILAPMSSSEVTAELTRVVDKWPAPGWERGFGALEALGHLSLPGLVVIATNRVRAAELRCQALESIGTIISRERMRARPNQESDRVLVTQVLVPYLEERDLAWAAASALGRARLNPEVVVQALTNAMRFEDMRTQTQVAAALGGFKRDARCAIPALTLRLSNADERIRLAATNALNRIAPEVLTNAVKNF
jgi:HEAT repeats